MRKSSSAGAVRSNLVSTLAEVAVYIALGAVSLSTAYVEANAAGAWIPSGYAVGLLTSRGVRRWPSIAIGSFCLNLVVNLRSGVATLPSIAVALAIALGNAAEAACGASITRRFAAGSHLLSRPRHVAIFALAAVPIAPLFSMIIGVAASRVGGLTASSGLTEVMLSWYVANAVGILIFTGPVVLALTPPLRRALTETDLGANQWAEACLLAICLIFASQAICGFHFDESLRGWPKTYMFMPLLIWASFRFGTVGALLAILVVAAVSIVGTMRGFAAFPASSPWRSLVYLQIFLGCVTVMTLLIAAGLSENRDLRATLEERVRARTREVELNLRDKETFTTLVAHDLQSPVYGLRNALRAAIDGLRSGRLASTDLIAAFAVMEESCVTLAERVGSLLKPGANGTEPGADALGLDAILAKIATAHRLRMDEKAVTLRIVGNGAIAIRAPDKVEHILDILIDNAIKFSPAGMPIEIATEMSEKRLDIRVTDLGQGVTGDEIYRLFERRNQAPRVDGMTGAGLGLYLAREQAVRLGGDLRYAPATPRGSTFSLFLPT